MRKRGFNKGFVNNKCKRNITRSLRICLWG